MRSFFVAVPPLTHLQASVLSLVGAQEVAGKVLRQRLATEAKVRLTGPAFYQAMSRLEDGGFVDARYKQRVTAGQAVRERVYRIRGHGSRALEATLQFYAEVGTAVDRTRLSLG